MRMHDLVKTLAGGASQQFHSATRATRQPCQQHTHMVRTQAAAHARQASLWPMRIRHWYAANILNVTCGFSPVSHESPGPGVTEAPRPARPSEAARRASSAVPRHSRLCTHATEQGCSPPPPLLPVSTAMGRPLQPKIESGAAAEGEGDAAALLEPAEPVLLAVVVA